MQAKRQMEQQDMGAMEDQQQQHGEEEQLVEVRTDPPRQCPRCNSLETMYGYYNNYCDIQPSYHCNICSHYWAHEEVPGDISVWKRKNSQHYEAPSTSTNRVCKIPRSSSSVWTNRQCDLISRNLASEEKEIYNLSSSMALHTSPLAPAMQSGYTMTPGSGLLSSVSGGVNQYLHPHGHPQQPQQQQQQLSDMQNFFCNGVVSQMPFVDQIPIPSDLPSITPLEMLQGLNNENNAVGLQPVSWNTNVSGLQSQVTHVLHSTTVMVFQQSVYNSGQIPVLPVLPSINPWELPQGFSQGNNSLGLEAESWNSNSNTWHNSSNTGELQSQLIPIQNTTTVPPFQQSLHNVGGVIDIEDVLWTNNSLNNSDGIGGFPVNPNFRPDQPNL